MQECHIVRSRLIDEAEHEFRLTELGKRRLVMPRNLLQETLKREGEAAFACSVRSAECAYLSFPDERRGDCAIPAPDPQACRACEKAPFRSFVENHPSRGQKDFDRWTRVCKPLGESEPIHAAWHLHVRKNCRDAPVAPQYEHRLIGVSCLYYRKPTLLQIHDRNGPNQRLVFYHQNGRRAGVRHTRQRRIELRRCSWLRANHNSGAMGLLESPMPTLELLVATRTPRPG